MRKSNVTLQGNVRLLMALMVASAGATSGNSASTCSCTVRGVGDVRLGPSRGASANSSTTGAPCRLSSTAAMREAYWARIQSILKRLATAIVTLEPSAATTADRGRIQVLNCCSGISCARRSTQVSHSDGASLAAGVGGWPSIMWTGKETVLVDKWLGAGCALYGGRRLIHTPGWLSVRAVTGHGLVGRGGT